MAGTLKKRAYVHIYEKLSNGELLPGDRLSGRALAKEIGISPIPVRDAISQLRNEGFIEANQDGTAFVPVPSYEQLMDIYDQREALECHAIVKMAESPEAEDLKQLDQYIQNLTKVLNSLVKADSSKRSSAALENWADNDASLHDHILRAAGNQLSLETVKSLRVKMKIFGMQVRFESVDSLEQTHQEHIEIVNCIRNRDTAGARLAMREHIRQGCRLTIEAHHRKRIKNRS